MLRLSTASFKYLWSENIIMLIIKHCMKLILTDVDNANLNILKSVLNVQNQHLTIHELSDDKIEFMIHDIATN